MSIEGTIWWVGEHPNFKSLQNLLEQNYESVKAVPDVTAFLDHYAHSDYGCVFVAAQMRGQTGLSLLKAVKDNGWPIAVCLLLEDAEDVMTAVQAMKQGAAEVLSLPLLDPQCLLDMVNTNVRETQARYQAQRRYELVESRFNQLTPREQQVMLYLVEGLLNKQIAERLSISLSTVELHRAKVMKKMQVRHLATLVVYYWQKQQYERIINVAKII